MKFTELLTEVQINIRTVTTSVLVALLHPEYHTHFITSFGIVPSNEELIQFLEVVMSEIDRRIPVGAA